MPLRTHSASSTEIDTASTIVPMHFSKREVHSVITGEENKLTPLHDIFTTIRMIQRPQEAPTKRKRANPGWELPMRRLVCKVSKIDGAFYRTSLRRLWQRGKIFASRKSDQSKAIRHLVLITKDRPSSTIPTVEKHTYCSSPNGDLNEALSN